MKWARVVDGQAADVRDETPEGYYTQEIVNQFIEVPDEVQNGWFWDGATWVNDDLEV